MDFMNLCQTNYYYFFRLNDCDIKQSNRYETKDVIAEVFMLHDDNG